MNKKKIRLKKVIENILNSSEGFSLLELLITLAIFGILLVTYLAYAFTVLNFFDFGGLVICFSLMVIALVSAILLISKKTSRRILGVIKGRGFKKIVLLTELVFTVSFLIFLKETTKIGPF